MNKFSRTLYLGAVLVAPFILTSTVHSVSANSQTSNPPVMRIGSSHSRYQRVADRQPTARRNARNPLTRVDGNYWRHRVNLAGYLRKPYHHPTINWNARDLGGYYAGRGYYTRPDKVFRGGDLHNISRNGIRTIKRLHIKRVVDLRSHHYQGGRDLEEGRRHNMLGVTYLQYPVNSLKQKHYLRSFKHRYGEIYKYGAPFTTWSQARWAYRQVFNQLLYHNQHGALYFHCIMGRDRTGVMSAIYLSALGVNKWNIYNDFLLTNYYNYKYSDRNQVAELNRFFRTVKHHYGTMHNYLHKGIGLSNNQLSRLRRLYLVKK